MEDKILLTEERSRNPHDLLRRFVLLSTFSVVAILILAGFFIYEILGRELIGAAERNAVAIGEAILSQEQATLLIEDADGKPRLNNNLPDFGGLDERIRRYLPPFQMYKIKIYSLDRTIVYSTDRSIVGARDQVNMRLSRVLETGEPDSKLEYKGAVWDLSGEQHFGVEVVETYLPIKQGNHIVGSFELYVDVTHTRQHIRTVVGLCCGVLLIVLVIVFAALYLPMRQGTLGLRDAQDKLRELATTDALTGARNRRYVLERIAEEFKRLPDGMKRRRAPSVGISLMMIDIDHFKSVNDEHGHPAGDEVLRQLAARLQSGLRDYDIMGRYGGEEFLILLPGTDLDVAKTVADRMRESIRSQPIEVEGKLLKVTISIGVACSAEGVDPMAELIRRADEGLYKAKASGRDRVAWV